MKEDLTLRNEKIVMKVSWYSIVVNVVLSVFKIFAGVVAKSGAMISDGIHSASDVLSTVIVMVGYKMSATESDERHQYGHERMECVAAILLAVVLCITGGFIGFDGLQKVFSADEAVLVIPGRLALVAAIVSVMTKEGMYWYTRAAAKKVNSSALMADAWHHRSDSLSSIGSFVGIIGARLGYPICDPIASIVICMFIIKVAIDIFKDAIDKMMDTACDKEIIEEMEAIICAQEGVISIDRLQTRLFGSRIYVDVEIVANASLTLEAAHAIAERVHDAIEDSFAEVKHCMVHVNPNRESKEVGRE